MDVELRNDLITLTNIIKIIIVGFSSKLTSRFKNRCYS